MDTQKREYLTTVRSSVLYRAFVLLGNTRNGQNSYQCPSYSEQYTQHSARKLYGSRVTTQIQVMVLSPELQVEVVHLAVAREIVRPIPVALRMIAKREEA